MGPYDLVIDASGTRSQLAASFRRRPAPRSFLVIGDARDSRWWDFGQRRIRQGANQALQDGWELGQALAADAKRRQRDQQARQQDRANGDLNADGLMPMIPEKFRAASRQQQQSSRVMSLRLFGIILVAVLWKACSSID